MSTATELELIDLSIMESVGQRTHKSLYLRVGSKLMRRTKWPRPSACDVAGLVQSRAASGALLEVE